MALNVIVLGPPGAGKGTQAERLTAERGLPKISTGDILREAIQQRTELGLQAKAIMDGGGLVSDDIMIGIVRERLGRPDARVGFVLDGFPRNVAQASALDALMTDRGPLVVINMVVPAEELVRRLGARRICGACGTTAAGFETAPSVPLHDGLGVGPTPAGGLLVVCGRCGGPLVQRPDDSERVVRERLRVYERDTRPLVGYYGARPTFRSIDGAQPPARVAADLAEAIDSARSCSDDRPRARLGTAS